VQRLGSSRRSPRGRRERSREFGGTRLLPDIEQSAPPERGFLKPTRGFEPLTPSLRGRRGVCGWLRFMALSAQAKPISAVRPRIVLRLVQGVVLPPCCHFARAPWRLAHNDAYDPGLRTRMSIAGFSAVYATAVSKVLPDDREAEIGYAAGLAQVNRLQLGRRTATVEEPDSVPDQNWPEADHDLVDPRR
jgi:hypothetical protein